MSATPELPAVDPEVVEELVDRVIERFDVDLYELGVEDDEQSLNYSAHWVAMVAALVARTDAAALEAAEQRGSSES